MVSTYLARQEANTDKDTLLKVKLGSEVRINKDGIQVKASSLANKDSDLISTTLSDWVSILVSSLEVYPEINRQG